VQAFIKREYAWARKAKDLRLMNTPNGKGRLPLHRALGGQATLGSIKLLVKANPLALRSPDENGALLLHTACQLYHSTNVIQYLLELDTTALSAVDKTGNTALHHACRGAKYDTISLLLDKFDAVSVSKRNAHKKLPIELLWESNEVSDRENVKYLGCVFQLLKAYPETSTNVGTQVQSTLNSGPNLNHSENGKKRKLGNE